jgi:uncharacterized protein (TIGR02996 family)
MTTFADHLAAIVAAPEDDAPRLALAAWLAPHQPALAAFIRLQVERVAELRRAGERDSELVSEPEQRLLAGHAAEWARGVASYVHGGAGAVAFHRGLIARVEMDPEVFLERGGYLLRAWPIRHVDFSPLGPGVLARLLDSELVSRLDSIGLIDPALGDDDVARVAASPSLARCAYLRLAGDQLGPRAFAALAGSSALPALMVVECSAEAFPGETVVVSRAAAGTTASPRALTAAGEALEAAHGYLPWLHRANRASRYDVRWYLDRGLLPDRRARTEAP